MMVPQFYAYHLNHVHRQKHSAPAAFTPNLNLPFEKALKSELALGLAGADARLSAEVQTLCRLFSTYSSQRLLLLAWLAAGLTEFLATMDTTRDRGMPPRGVCFNCFWDFCGLTHEPMVGRVDVTNTSCCQIIVFFKNALCHSHHQSFLCAPIHKPAHAEHQ